MTRAVTAALLFCFAVFGWLIGHNLSAAEPAPSIATLETAAREACEAQGLTLRALTVVYDPLGTPVAGRAACGEPRRSKA